MKTRAAGLILVSMIMIAAWLGIERHARHQGTIMQKRQQLMELSDQIGMHDSVLIYKMGADGFRYRAAKGGFQAKCAFLSRLLGLPAAAAASDKEGHPLYTVKTVTPQGLQVLLAVIGMKGGKGTYIQLNIIAAGSDHFQAAEKWRETADAAIKHAGFRPKWNVNLQGYSTRDFNDSKDALRHAMDKDSHAVQQGSYRDVNTWSASYAAGDDNGMSAADGGHRIAMQAALHRLTTNGAVRVTLGAPLITVEF